MYLKAFTKSAFLIIELHVSRKFQADIYTAINHVLIMA